MVFQRDFLKILFFIGAINLLFLFGIFNFKISSTYKIRSRTFSEIPDINLNPFEFPSNPWLVESSKSGYQSRQMKNCSFKDKPKQSTINAKVFLKDYVGYIKCRQRNRFHFPILALRGSRNELILYSDYQYAIEPQLALKEYSILFIIFANKYSDRQRHRESWLQDLNSSEGYFFCASDETLSLKTENLHHGDILISKNDSTTLFWLHSRDVSSQFVVMTKSNSLIHLNTLRRLTTTESYASSRIYGKLIKNHVLNRSHDFSEEEWPWSHFPNFISAAFYMFTGDVVAKLLAASSQIPRLEKLTENIYTTGILSMESSVLLIDMKSFISESTARPCKAAIFTGVEEAIQTSLWEEIRSC